MEPLPVVLILIFSVIHPLPLLKRIVRSIFFPQGFPGALHDLRFNLPDQSGVDVREDVIQQRAVITRENGATALGGVASLAHGDHLPRGGMRSLQDTCNLNSVLVESSLVPQAEGCYRKRSETDLLIFDHETENQSIYVELFGSEVRKT